MCTKLQPKLEKLWDILFWDSNHVWINATECRDFQVIQSISSCKVSTHDFYNGGKNGNFTKPFLKSILWCVFKIHRNQNFTKKCNKMIMTV